MKIWPFVLAAAVLFLLVKRWGRFSWELRIGSLLLIAGLCVYGSGAVEVPNVQNLITDAGKTLGQWTYLLVGGLAFLETGAFVGLVAPGEFTIVLGGVVAGQGVINVVLLIGIVWAAAVLGDTASFVLGRKLGRDFMITHGKKVKITEERVEKVEVFFEKHGGKTILIGRFVGLVRALAPFLAGASRMQYRRFLPYDILGAGIWAASLCLLGYAFWQSFSQVEEIASKGAFALGAVITFVVFVAYTYAYLKRPENRARLRGRIHDAAEWPLLRPIAKVVRPFVYGVLVPLWRRAVGPLSFFWHRITPGNLGLELTTLLAIGAVGGFTFFAFMSFVLDHRFLVSDGEAHNIAVDFHSTAFTDAAQVVSWFGNLYVVAAIVVLVSVYLIIKREVVEGIALTVAMALTVGAVQLTKYEVARPRPAYELVEVSGYAYPSAHAAYAMAFVAVAVALRHVVPWFAGRFTIVVVALASAVAIGLSRIYLGVHYLSDVLGGWGLGAAIFSLCGIVALVVSYLRKNPLEQDE